MAKIGLDMDGVIVDFMTPICDQLGIDINSIKSFKLDDELPERLDEIRGVYCAPGYFRDLDPYPGAIDFIHELREKHDVYFVTRPSSHSVYSWSDKAQWIKNYIPEMLSTTIMTPNKDLVNVDFLIDDDPRNIEITIAPYRILFNQPWNRNADEEEGGYNRLYNYREIIGYVKRICSLNSIFINYSKS